MTLTSFATPTELKTFLGVNTVNEERAQMFLDDASGLIRKHADQLLDAVDGDEIAMNPSRTRRLFLPERPVRAITSVLVDLVPLAAFNFTFETYGVLRRTDGGVWDADPQGIAVVYSHGFTEIPDWIVTICKSVAARAYTSAPPAAMGDSPFPLGETAGFAPGVFLMPSEAKELETLKPVIW